MHGPIDRLPIDRLPIDRLPIDRLPIDRPPIDRPPIDRPPVDRPPVDRPPVDRHRRPLRNLRISVTDRCNLRCSYCMPEENYTWLAKRELLTYEEIDALVDAFVALGVTKVRLTGGEPLLRRDLSELVRALVAKPALTDIALTTNGLLLPAQAEELRRAGLSRVTVSLDSLDRERYRRMNRRDGLGEALEGIRAAKAAGFSPIKLNAVVIAGSNDDEIPALVDFARTGGHELRFIEYMDVGGATQWRPEQVLSSTGILERVEDAFGPIEPVERTDAAPAERYRLADGTVFGLIASTTRPFCGSCDRARLTADGRLFTCLYATSGIQLAPILRAGATPDELEKRLRSLWGDRTDRGAEERASLADRGAWIDSDTLRDDPHLEMHTRGG